MMSNGSTHPTAREVRSRAPATCRRPTPYFNATGFLLTAVCYGGLLLASVALPWWPVRLLAAVLNGWLIFLLLCFGHDAAHGNLTPCAWLNNLIGRLAFLPSLTPFSVWQDTHNRQHHRYTNLRGYDPAYCPFSKEEYDRLPPYRRVLERWYKTAPGLALYYVIEIWWKLGFFYSGRGRRPRRKVIYSLDRLSVLGFVVAQAVAVWNLQVLVLPPEAEAPAPKWPGLLIGLGIPWLAFTWFIGFLSFLHHTHPWVRWYASRSEWNFYRGQVQGAVHVVFPWPWECLLHPIMEHTAHHADCLIATARLKEFQRRLEEAYADIVVERFTPAYLRWVLATCQLYDYQNYRWLDFAGNPTSPRRADNSGREGG